MLEKCVIFRMTNLSGLIPGVGSLQLIEMFAGLLETFTTEEILGKLAKMGTERCSLAAKQIVAFWYENELYKRYFELLFNES